MEDETVASPAQIPPDAWKILQQDSSIKNVLDSEGMTAEQLPRNWFQASTVHLNSPSEKDLLVIASGKLLGANVTTFWLFMQTPQGTRLVLNAPAHDLFIRSSRTNGHRDVELVALTAIRIMTSKYRFDGTQYRLVKSTDEPIK
ncbi:MAG: hypothetical protein JSS95_09755 [Acidobacteria bacterium]|nr:hypothetical protein [Acidobacteriota bacterium]